MSHQEILEAIEKMSVLELSELIKAIEDRLACPLPLPWLWLLPAPLPLLLLPKKRRPSLTWFSRTSALRRSRSSRLFAS